MRTIIRANKGTELTKMLEVQKILLESSVNSDISIVLKLADSLIIKRYFADPGGDGMEGIISKEISSYMAEIALEELSSYGRFFSEGYSIFWINDVDRIFHINNNEPYWLDPDNPDNYWYNMTLYETEVYNFNINYNPDLQVINLWINAPVFDNDHKPIGIVGSGIDLSTFVDMVYQNVGEKVELFFFNGLSEITGANDINLVSNKIDIMSVLGDKGVAVFAEANRLQPGETKTFDAPNGKLAIGTVPLLEWYMVAFMPDSISDYKTAMTVLFLVVLMLVLVIFIIFNLAIVGYLKSLRETMESLKIASEAKNRFVANMSHEMRTPMNAIIGFSELAMDDQISDETREYLNRIIINSELLLQIINNLLDISKIESGKMELEHVPFDLHELFIACRTMMVPKAEEKGVTLFFYAEPIIGKKMLGDPLRLRQVFINLLSNAVKFTNKGGIVKIAATEVPGPAVPGTITVTFEVRDSGIGMTPEQIAKVSQPFMQADMATTRKYGGTGLGLAISRNIIVMMGSRLNVESTPRVGSKFSFDVTFETVEQEKAASQTTFIESPANRPQLSGEVLLCENNQMNQQVLSEHLKRIGIKADIAENGREGYNMVRNRHEKGEKPYDLIFMDIHMPVMDGIEASTLINQLDTGTPIVVMTANIMSQDMELYQKCGMKDCIGKPFKAQELWDCLMKYLKPVESKAEDEAENRQYDEKLMLLLKATFVRDNKARCSEITAAITAGDIKLANRLVQTLKSNAGQLGKARLQKAAEDIEHLLADGKNHVTQSLLNILETELNAVLNDFKPQVKKSTPSAPSQPEQFETSTDWNEVKEVTPLDAETTQVMFTELEPLLEAGNPQCLKYIDKLRGIPGTEKLIQQMEDLDFEEATETLSEIRKN
jgi:signal transduction histidine kinase/CheY-like chemotaxis protein